MLIKNINFLKIIFVLKKDQNSITTKELADATNINYKNIGKYLSRLEKLGFVEREIFQDGKIRYILNFLADKGERFEITPFYSLIVKDQLNMKKL